MKRILIIEKDIECSIRILNYISARSNKIQVYSIFSNVNDAIRILKKETIDLILIGIEDQKSYIDIYNKLIKTKYDQKVLFLYKNRMSINYNKFNNWEWYCRAQNLEEIYRHIERICLDEFFNENSIRVKIKTELKHLRFNFGYDGTLYLEDAIMCAYKKQNEYKDINMKNDIYPFLSRKYKKSVNCIKTNITNAVNIMYFECPEMILMEYFNCLTVIKPTTKKLVITIVNKIKKSPLYNDAKRDKIKRA